MTQKEKQLLLKDLCARLPYCVKVNYKGLIRPLFSTSPTQYYQITLDNAIDSEHNGLELVSLDIDGVELKPYLRPMSSMTEEEREEWMDITNAQHWLVIDNLDKAVDWLDAHHFDYRGLIEMGLALEAPEDMYR